MWHTGRCGSSVVADLIRDDGRIDWAGEVLEQPSNAWTGLKGDEALRRCRDAISRRCYDAGRKPFGFELKLWHHHRLELTASDMNGLTTELGFRLLVVLERKNRLRQYVSGRLAARTGQYHRHAGEGASAATVDIDLDAMGRLFDLYEGYYRILRGMLPGALHLTYEADIEADPTVAYAKIMRHVGLDPASVTTDRKKTTDRPLPAVIANFQEVADRLSGTRHEWMLGE